MKLDYTEFSFGYAFTENLIRAAAKRPAGAPIFPNLIQEAKLGYDVKINLPGCPLYFQYKLPELMVRDSAFEISQLALPGIKTPFFRMPLMRRDLSHQHALLIELSTKFPNAVFYATPSMTTSFHFNIAYSSANVHNNTTFFYPAEIGDLPDDKQHTVAYRHRLNYAWLCSDPRRIKAFSFRDIEQKSRKLFSLDRFRTLRDASSEILEEVINLAPPEFRETESEIRQRIRSRTASTVNPRDVDAPKRQVIERLLVAREIARVGLGVDMLIAQPAS